MSKQSQEPTSDGRDELAQALVEFDEITQIYRVLPHERWAALRIVNNVYSMHPKPSKITKKDGVIGCVGMGVVYMSGSPSAVLGFVGLLLLFASGGAPWSYAIGAIGIAGCAISLLRAIPFFRAGQRYLKTGDWRPARIRHTVPPGGLGSLPPSPSASLGPFSALPPPPFPPAPPSRPTGDPSETHGYDKLGDHES